MEGLAVAYTDRPVGKSIPPSGPLTSQPAAEAKLNGNPRKGRTGWASTDQRVREGGREGKEGGLRGGAPSAHQKGGRGGALGMESKPPFVNPVGGNLK